jgi:hypothetical protein
MKKPILAVAVVLAACCPAWAVDTLLPNGSFEQDAASGFGQTISNWSFSGPAAGALPANQAIGLFTSFGKFNPLTVPNGAAPQFVVLDNIGNGTATLTSGASGVNFAVGDRNLGFRYVYMTNDPAAAASHDAFRVHIDFFATATSTTVIGSIDKLVANSAALNDTNVGFSPFGGAANSATATYNNSGSSGAQTFNLFNVDVSAFFNSFERVSFIVDNGGPAAGTNGNGLGVSGVVLDGVVLNPEPSAIALFALGVAGLGGFAWRRRKTAKLPA